MLLRNTLIVRRIAKHITVNKGAFQIVARFQKISTFVQIKLIKNKDMTKEEFLAIAEGHYVEFEDLKESPTFYDYEKSLERLMQKISCQYMEKHLNEGSVSIDRRKKKL